MEHNVEFDFLICGVKLQKPYNGSLISVSKYELPFRGKTLQNLIRVKYQVKVEGDADANQEFINQVIVSETNIFFYVFSLLLANPCQAIERKTWLDGLEVKPKFPPRGISSIYNMQGISQKLEEVQRYTSVIHTDGWAVLDELIAEIRPKLIEKKSKIELALRWFSKASDETFSVDRFVSYWIAFNALYERSGNEREAIERHVDYILDSSIAKRLVGNQKMKHKMISLSSRNIELFQRNKPSRVVSKELESLLQNPTNQDIAIVKTMVLTIYGIRNYLFHGDFDPDSEEIIEYVGRAERLLAEFLKEIIAKQILGYPLPSTLFVQEIRHSH